MENAVKNLRLLRVTCHDYLNVGKYCDVPLHWRQGYYYTSYLLAYILSTIKDSNQREILRIADEGILMGSPITRENLLQDFIEDIEKSFSHIKLPSENLFLAEKIPELKFPVRRISSPPWKDKKYINLIIKIF